MKRVVDVIDVWYDSGSMPFAQWHYPFENKDLFDKYFPADYISEGIDQTRGWFFTLLVISTLIFDKSPFRNVITLGLVLDQDGQKMSKSKGNVVSPWEIFETIGADALRWYFYISSAPWLPARFHQSLVVEAQRKFIGTLWNVYAFYIMYAAIDGFDPTKYSGKQSSHIMDKWVLSKLNTLVQQVNGYLDNYKITEAAKEINTFVDDLSNWYVRRSRERFWEMELNDTKVEAFLTLYEVLHTLTRVIAPFVPFISEEIYQNVVRSVDLKAPESVHLCDFPVAKKEAIDVNLEKKMSLIISIVTLGRSARNIAKIKVRQPLQKMYFSTIDDPDLTSDLISIIKDELNIKEVTYAQDMDDIMTYTCKPNFSILGPKAGKLMPQIAEGLQQVGGDFVKSLTANGSAELKLKDEQTVILTKEDVVVQTQPRERFVVETDNKVTVGLDITLTEELINEGIMREVISKIQTMRKESGFEVTDRINFYYFGDERVCQVIKQKADYIKKQTLAEKLIHERVEFQALKAINNQALYMGVQKL